MYSLFAAAHLCNFTITVCIGQEAAYWKTCKANGAAPLNAAVATINLYHLLIDGERFKFKYTVFLLERNTFILRCGKQKPKTHRTVGAVRNNSISSGDLDIFSLAVVMEAV